MKLNDTKIFCVISACKRYPGTINYKFSPQRWSLLHNTWKCGNKMFLEIFFEYPNSMALQKKIKILPQRSFSWKLQSTHLVGGTPADSGPWFVGRQVG